MTTIQSVGKNYQMTNQEVLKLNYWNYLEQNLTTFHLLILRIKAMTPKEYESFVCEKFTQDGYKTKLTNYNNDYGIDVFAFKGNEKLGIQVKMFGHTTRKVNRQMIMELHGSKDLFQCTKAIMVTDGQIIDNAKDVAGKLGIEILFIQLDDNYSNNVQEVKDDPFDRIWENIIKPLEGKVLTRDNNKTNKIITVDWSGIERITSNGKRQKIKIEIFRLTVNMILSEGSITRDFINQEYKDRASSGIVLILSQVPFFDFYKNPARLVLNIEKYKGI